MSAADRDLLNGKIGTKRTKKEEEYQSYGQKRPRDQTRKRAVAKKQVVDDSDSSGFPSDSEVAESELYDQ